MNEIAKILVVALAPFFLAYYAAKTKQSDTASKLIGTVAALISIFIFYIVQLFIK